MNLEESPIRTPVRNAHTPSSSLGNVLSWIVTLLVPVILVLASVRVLLNPAFLSFEYNSPKFPPDTYGFTLEDRLYWSNIDLDYLLNQEGISFLGDLHFSDGSAAYNPRELQHMVDVKIVLQKALLVWYFSLGAMFILGVWAWRGGWLNFYFHGLSRGGFATSALILLIIAFVLFGFRIFFVAFHQVFFETGTWIFNYSDTLIRLFPERFWRDVFIFVGLLSFSGGLMTGFVLRSSSRSNSKLIFKSEKLQHIP